MNPNENNRAIAETQAKVGPPIGATTFVLLQNWLKIGGIGIATGFLGFAASHFVPPTFTARATFIAPQPQQGPAASALASLGALGALAGGAGIKNNADQFVSLMQSDTLCRRIVNSFKLSEAYETQLQIDTLKQLRNNTRISASKKDGLITVEFDDKDPQRAAAIANAYIDELKVFTDDLNLTEAKNRRQFFETQLQITNEKLTAAQQRLESSGVSVSLLKTEPRAAAESISKLSAELIKSEIALESIEGRLANSAPEVLQQKAIINELKRQIKIQSTRTNPSASDDSYASKYREYKYNEALFEIISKQFEAARIDEARESAPIQVIDAATPPEKKSKPKPLIFALIGFLAGSGLAAVFMLRHHLQQPKTKLN